MLAQGNHRDKFGVLTAILTWRQADNFLELIIEMRRIVESDHITDLGNAQVVIDQHLAGIPDLDLIEELNVCFVGMRLEETAKGSRAHAGNFGDILKGRIFHVAVHNKLVHLVDAFAIILSNYANESVAAKQIILPRFGHDLQDREQIDDLLKTIPGVIELKDLVTKSDLGFTRKPEPAAGERK
mgnify:CR=1 FL=1